MGEYLTTEAWASRHGISSSTARRLISRGKVPGAIRISGTTGPWRIPAHAVPGQEDSTPHAPERMGGVSAESHRTGPRPDLMSRSASPSAAHADTAMKVSQQLHGLTTRPALAASAMLAPLVAIVSRHYANRDGWCAACSWQFPCRDYTDAANGLQAAADVVLDGTR